MSHIFLSYSRKDAEILRTIAAYLAAKDFELWTDENLTPGTHGWKVAIERAIEASGAVVAIMTPNAKESEWVDRELEYARLHKRQIFPLLASGDAVSSVPLELVTSQWIDISQVETYNVGLEKLVLTLDGHLGIVRKSKTQMLIDELAYLADKLPSTYWMGIFSIEGLNVAFYEGEPAFAEEVGIPQVAAMSATLFGLGDRVSERLKSGSILYNVSVGQSGVQFNVALNHQYILSFGLRNVLSIDATFVILRQWWHPLFGLLEIEGPPRI